MKMVISVIVILIALVAILITYDAVVYKDKNQSQAFRCIDNILHYNVGYNNHLQYHPVMKNGKPEFCPITEIEVICKRGYAFTYTDFNYTITRYEKMDAICQPKN